MVVVRAEERIALLVTNHGKQVMVIFWMASSFRQFDCDNSGSQARPAFDRIDRFYIQVKNIKFCFGEYGA